MADSISTRIVDLPLHRVRHFLLLLDKAGWTSKEILHLLEDDYEPLRAMASTLKSLLAASDGWIEVAPGVQMRYPHDSCAQCRSAGLLLVRTQDKSDSCGTIWTEARPVGLIESWIDIAPGVQARKSLRGIEVRHTTVFFAIAE